MSKPKRRRRWTAEKKLKIVLETPTSGVGPQSDRKLAEICRRECEAWPRCGPRKSGHGERVGMTAVTAEDSDLPACAS